ncbi:hypothetical protein [Streptosporangium minutum]|uniref:hypothetical protein n=1 Tax=Streptosporangium minutum TaxID=569862 RepID=UPI0013FE209D|nr:hypothetical protein [Streptosporangium minutum]
MDELITAARAVAAGRRGEVLYEAPDLPVGALRRLAPDVPGRTGAGLSGHRVTGGSRR